MPSALSNPISNSNRRHAFSSKDIRGKGAFDWNTPVPRGPSLIGLKVDGFFVTCTQMVLVCFSSQFAIHSFRGPYHGSLASPHEFVWWVGEASPLCCWGNTSAPFRAHVEWRHDPHHHALLVSVAGKKLALALAHPLVVLTEHATHQQQCHEGLQKAPVVVQIQHRKVAAPTTHPPTSNCHCRYTGGLQPLHKTTHPQRDRTQQSAQQVVKDQSRWPSSVQGVASCRGYALPRPTVFQRPM